MIHDFETKVFKKEKYNFGGMDEYIIRGGRDLFPLLPKVFDGIKVIGVIGWGSQGPAQAQNLRDSFENTGIQVKVGLRRQSSSWHAAERAGFTEANDTLCEMYDLIAQADLVLLLISDAAQAQIYPQILPKIKDGATLGLSHGFLKGYMKAYNDCWPKNINVIAVCPKGMGPSVRRLYEQGKEVNGAGINCSFAVDQDIDGRATDIALGWAVALGAPFTFKTTMEAEYRSDIFGERGVLLGAIHGIVEALYERYTVQGMSPETAFKRSTESLTGPINNIISHEGMSGLYNKFECEDRKVFEEAYLATYHPMFEILWEIYDEVVSLNELKGVVMAGIRHDRYPMGKIDNTPIWKVGEKVRAARKSLHEYREVDPFTAGCYVACMMAQVDLLLEKHHVMSEVVNESIIEAVDSLTPYMHSRGVAYMVDNCSVTARLGARKWAPRFDYLLSQIAFPAIDTKSVKDNGELDAFRNHRVHKAMETCAKLRPSVDICVL
ncbi:ketol-acid reductoisomerase [Candidatus Haliotispira prima]|uniref:Acetohydroxy-acid isomeroreductase n=1 Tax=Candidatus Haliotispira prima TaxID=3034016 RepID=A0ABY8ME70_9SPIO|nr:ketol-acid reductoisomerase [Candidatus Haliotispira prima]